MAFVDIESTRVPSLCVKDNVKAIEHPYCLIALAPPPPQIPTQQVPILEETKKEKILHT